MSNRRFPIIPALLGAGVALFLGLLLPTSKLPLQLVSVFAGEPVTDIDLVGGLAIELRVQGDREAVRSVANNLRRRFERAGHDAAFSVGDERIVAHVLRANPEQAELIPGLLRDDGRLELKMVDHDAPFMRKLTRNALTGVDSEIWQGAETGDRFSDQFLTAPTRRELAATIERITPEQDRELAIEDREDGTARSYYLHSRVELDNSAVANARVEFNEYTNYPEVLLTFTEDGARRFHELTATHIGHKLAIIVNGRITSAPIIQAAIPGGQAAISLGGNRPMHELQAEAAQLAASLGSTPLAAPVEMTTTALVPVRVSGTPLLLARLALALAVGLVAFGIAFVVQRRLAPRTA